MESNLGDDINPGSPRELFSKTLANIELRSDGALLSGRACGVKHKNHGSGKMLEKAIRNEGRERDTASEAKVKRSISFLSSADLSNKPGESMTWILQS